MLENGNELHSILLKIAPALYFFLIRLFGTSINKHSQYFYILICSFFTATEHYRSRWKNLSVPGSRLLSVVRDERKLKGQREKRGRTDAFLALAFPRSFSHLLSCFRSSTTAESLEQARSNFKTQLYTFQLFYHSSKSHLLAIKHYVSRFIFELRIKTTIYSSCIRR